HSNCYRNWSSDLCSSDLLGRHAPTVTITAGGLGGASPASRPTPPERDAFRDATTSCQRATPPPQAPRLPTLRRYARCSVRRARRSAVRRVGREEGRRRRG